MPCFEPEPKVLEPTLHVNILLLGYPQCGKQSLIQALFPLPHQPPQSNAKKPKKLTKRQQQEVEAATVKKFDNNTNFTKIVEIGFEVVQFQIATFEYYNSQQATTTSLSSVNVIFAIVSGDPKQSKDQLEAHVEGMRLRYQLINNSLMDEDKPSMFVIQTMQDLEKDYHSKIIAGDNKTDNSDTSIFDSQEYVDMIQAFSSRAKAGYLTSATAKTGMDNLLTNVVDAVKHQKMMRLAKHSRQKKGAACNLL